MAYFGEKDNLTSLEQICHCTTQKGGKNEKIDT